MFKKKGIREKKQSIFFRLFKLFIWIAIIYIWVNYYNYTKFENKILNKEEKIITINNWDTFRNLPEKIDWINETYLKYYLKNNTPDFKLQAWNYKIWAEETIWEIISDLNKPAIVEEIQVTFLEWWNIYDIDNYLSKNNLITKWEYISYVENLEKIEKLKKFFPFLWNIKSLEWYLYPDTYKINSPVKINELVIKQLENFENKVYNKILKKLDKKTIYDLLKLASIVEKEEKNPDEKSTVAWILKKRLNSNWNIWADITVCYPHKLTAEECKMVVSKYIKEKSEYNTRTMIWLPKTPIWNPSFETINATLNDNKTDYWFYLHNVKTWKIYYAKTNSEHEANKKYMY